MRNIVLLVEVALDQLSIDRAFALLRSVSLRRLPVERQARLSAALLAAGEKLLADGPQTPLELEEQAVLCRGLDAALVALAMGHALAGEFN